MPTAKNNSRRIAAGIALLISGMLNCFGAVNVKDFGAKGDGANIDSRAINAAIQKVADDGGGTVIIPSGTYLSYSIRMKDHVNLHLETGARLVAAKVTDEYRYDLPEAGPEPQYQDFGHSHWQNSLIWGIGLEDVRISGFGTIDGSNLGNGYSTEALLDGLANKAIAFKDCRNVTIENVTIFKGGHFAILFTGTDGINVSGITIDTNRDGIDIDCCRNVKIIGCSVNSPQDDAIVLKASYALGRFVDTQDVTIIGCNISGYDVGSLLDATYKMPTSIYLQMGRSSDKTQHKGRIKLGTESSGGFKNVSITGCTFEYSGGLLIESVDGGIVEDIIATNLVMRHCSDSPVFIRLGERMRSPEGTAVGKIRRVNISDVISSEGDPSFNCIIAGTPGHPIEDIVLDNIRINTLGGKTMEEALRDIPEAVEKYPDPWLFGSNRDHCLPFSGMMLRHVNRIHIKGLYFSFEEKDSRKLFWIEDVHKAVFENIYSEGRKIKLRK